MGMSGTYGPADEAESIATIGAALDAGISLLDTGDYYGMGHNELLIRQALRGRDRDGVVLSVKFGALRAPDNAFIDAGWVRHVGLSEAGAETLRRAQATHPVADLQIEYSLLSRGIEAEILPTCRQLGVGVTAYGVLARGLLAGTWSTRDAASPGDIRARMPRFRPENLDHNLALVDALRPIAEEKGATVAQLAIGWVLSRGEDIVPLVGTTRRDRLDEAIGAVGLELTQDDLAAIDRAMPTGAAAGERYDERQMAMLDSEQRRPPRPSHRPSAR